MKTLDMRGNPCPIPVISAKKELAQQNSDGVCVIVDNIVAVQNLEKMAKGLGYSFSSRQQDELTFAAIIQAEGSTLSETALQSIAVPTTTTDGVTVLITNNQMGTGSEELGKILIKGFLFSLCELPTLPKAVLFLNAGVHLAAEGSNTVADLQALAAKGCKIYSCGTCLNYYSLTEKLAVGEICDMFAIANHLASASRLITL